MNDFASLCILNFNRLNFLNKSLDSLHKNTDYPYEVILNDDASSTLGMTDYLKSKMLSRHISKLILNTGENRGIARSVHNCFRMAEGKYFFKLDTDLIYKPNWLSTIIGILENNKDVVMAGLFDYRFYDPNDQRFKVLEERPDCYIVNDFVSSGFGFKRDFYAQYGYLLGEDGWHLQLRDRGFKIAIPKKDVVTNIGFGIGKSSFVIKENGKLGVQGHSDKPFIFTP